MRVKFTNKLPTGDGGDLFIPVDTSVMGAGEGPDDGEPCTRRTARRCTSTAALTPWISDGTPHQWITPAGENTPYPKGVSVKNVPDMPDPGDGSHDVLLHEPAERPPAVLPRPQLRHHAPERVRRRGRRLPASPTRPRRSSSPTRSFPSDQIPLIIQDKTFVDADDDRARPTRRGTGASTPGTPHTGDLWVPHVYVPAQNPADARRHEPDRPLALRSVVLAAGRPTSTHPPDPQPLLRPHQRSVGAAADAGDAQPVDGHGAFNDTPLVNGTAYPKLTVEPKAYRLRILNAANDRFFNLQMYVADGNGARARTAARTPR